jgi:Rrf2 family nitric oxide-sensitive transcriptional repressor
VIARLRTFGDHEAGVRMRLSEYTDYTLRMLMYCAAHPDRRVTIGEWAERHGLSKNHLMKVDNDLARQGLVETTRGRGGGLRLSVDPEAIRIGAVVRAAETDFRPVACFDPATNACTLSGNCRLKHLLGEALQAYFAALDAATLADLSAPAAAAGRGTAPVPVRRGPAVERASSARRVRAS